MDDFEILTKMARTDAPELYELTDNPQIYLHWTAGRYGVSSEHYHICIDKDGTIEFMCESLAEKLSHTYGRNSGNIGIAIEGCYDAVVYDDEKDGHFADMGSEPPTAKQLDTMAKCIAIICRELEIPIDDEHVITHAEAADEDGYGLDDDDPDCRWDGAVWHSYDVWGTGGDIIRKMAQARQEADNV